MKLPRRRDNAKTVSASKRAAASLRVAGVAAHAPLWTTHPWLTFGVAFGVVGGLLGALEVVCVALAIAFSQRQIISYTTQYTTYQECLRQNPTPALCQAPTSGVLTVSAIWLLFLGATLLTFVLAQVAYAAAARAVALRTGSQGVAASAAMLAACVGWVFYLVASVGAVFLQASPFTMTAPPPGVDTTTLHLGTAIGSALFAALTLLPAVLVAMLAGLLVAQHELHAPRRTLVSLPPTTVSAPSLPPAPIPAGHSSFPPQALPAKLPPVILPPTLAGAASSGNHETQRVGSAAAEREVGV